MRLCGLTIGLSLVALLSTAAVSQDVKDAASILKGLVPVQTRTADPTMPERKAKLRELKERLNELEKKRLTIDDRNKLAKLIEESKLPAVDVQLLFAFDSAEILPEGKSTLDELGKALSSQELSADSFLIAGHTDAKGTDAYNLSLSKRRAQSVKAFLTGAYHIDGVRLSVIGFGKQELKSPDNPFADENRRVHVVNLGPPSAK